MFDAFQKQRLKIHERPHERVDDPLDRRLVDYVTAWEGSDLDALLSQLKPTDAVVLGYPDDRGVERNGGRLGASEGPDRIRHHLYRLVPSANLGPTQRVFDLGNLKTWSYSLNDAQRKAREVVGRLQKTGAKVLTFGGGHDWAYPDFRELGAAHPNSRLYVLNVDSHLDMRPYAKEGENTVHSGMPFRKLLEEIPPLSSSQFRLGVLGLGRAVNARHHVEWAEGHRVTLQFCEDLEWDLETQWKGIVEKFELGEDTIKKNIFGLSIDMDVFSQSDSPGVSAPQAFGINPSIVRRLILELGTQCRHLGIYELNPRLDADDASARLAARLALEFISPFHS